MTEKFDSIIFDVDGTLWDSTELVAEAYNQAFEQEGVDVRLTGEILKSLCGKPMDVIFDEILPNEPPERRAALGDKAMEMENALLEQKSPVYYPEVKETMEKLTSEPYRDAMMEFIDFDTLDERMKGTNTITMEFEGNVSGWCRARFIAVDYDRDARLSRVLWAVECIDAEKKKENLLLYLSETDLMTGIRNRGSGEKKIKELIESGHEGTFYLLDVDEFKSINDIYGHNIGDKVLIAVADSLKNSFQNSDVVMRLGGDEFAVFACDILEEGAAVSRIENFFRCIEAMDIPELGDHKIYISLGAAFKRRDDGEDFDSLYRDADSCTYESKKTKGNTYTFHK